MKKKQNTAQIKTWKLTDHGCKSGLVEGIVEKFSF